MKVFTVIDIVDGTVMSVHNYRTEKEARDAIVIAIKEYDFPNEWVEHKNCWTCNNTIIELHKTVLK
jgi:hypothetical protein